VGGGFVVDGDPSAVGAARRFAIEQALSSGFESLAADVELLTSELVTNALLHAGPPVQLRVTRLGDGVRIEVEDSSRAAPLRARPSADSMTGRGLALVEALSSRWGAVQHDDGKVMWCELRAGAGSRADSEVAAPVITEWDDAVDNDEPRFEVRLGDVPTDLLLAAKAHVDNLVRELALVRPRRDAESHDVPPQLVELVESAVRRFDEARQSIRRQALEAAAQGHERTELVLRVPARAADAGAVYLAALDQADAFARAARLLTLETPPQHRVFRRWYVQSLMDQLRRVADGEPPAPPVTLERRLLDELGMVAAAQRASDRAARLHAVTASLASADTRGDIAVVAVTEGVSVLAADRGVFVVRDNDGARVLSAVGYSQAMLAAIETGAARLGVDDVLATGEPVWVESRRQLLETSPGVLEVEPATSSLCAYPLLVGAQVVGVLRFGFDRPRAFDRDEQAFVAALSAQAAQAIDRALVHEAEQVARASAEAYAGRLVRVQRLTAELAAAVDTDAIADVVVAHAAEALGAQIATMSLLTDEHTLRVVRHSPSTVVAGWSVYAVDDTTPAGEAVLTNAPVTVITGPDLDARYPTLAGSTQPGRPLICVPLSVGDTRLGVISLSFPADHDLDDPSEIGFLTTLADACAQALGRTRALAAAQESAAKLAFLAAASDALSSTLDYRTTIANVSRLVVPRLADWCSVTLLEDGELRTVAVSHADPGKVEFAHEIQERYPESIDADDGAAEVIRSGQSQLWPVITDELLVGGARDADHLRLLRTIGMSSVLLVPLTGRLGTFGAVTMVAAESGRHYDEDDLVFAEELARRIATAVENAAAYRQQTGRLAQITRVAEAAQHAILAPPPPRLGPLRLAAAYVSATKEALVGGDFYEVVRLESTTRMLIGDVQGKGLDAVRLATVVLGEFRSAAVEQPLLDDLVRQMDTRLAAYLDAEGFVTAIVADIDDDGRCRLVNCGHPPALLAHGGTLTEVGSADSPPLGVGVEPVVHALELEADDRLLLYTDGLLEARAADGRFVDAAAALMPVLTAPADVVLARILELIRADVGGELTDDLAMVLVELVG
jgi:serine phosphatase RsbU (regulator of sigma subunit)/anti-sigma regulatory factor (Ser/Thr protein kinase)